MIDKIELRIPFKSEYVFEKLTESGKYYSSIDLNFIASTCDLACKADISYDIHGKVVVSGLSTKYDSLPSSFTGIAFKVFDGGLNMAPCVSIKASPAKVMQGHNVFGSCDLELGSFELLAFLSSVKPELYDLLDIPNTEVVNLDFTFSARAENELMAKQIIDFLKSVSHSQTKKTRASEYDTTVYWNHGSRSRVLKAYLKFPELMRQLTMLKNKSPKQLTDFDKKTISVLSNPELHSFTHNLVRFEASLYKRYFVKNNIPTNLFSLINHQNSYIRGKEQFIYDMWKTSFKDIFNAIGDSTMDVYDDNSILDKLKQTYYSTTPKGNLSYSKANRLFGFYRRLVSEGYPNVQATMDRKTFYRHEKDLISVGVSKAQLQNLSAETTNIVPLFKVVNIDFSNQRPSWYNEPISHFAVAM